jgi:hypothetical protein
MPDTFRGSDAERTVMRRATPVIAAAVGLLSVLSGRPGDGARSRRACDDGGGPPRLRTRCRPGDDCRLHELGRGFGWRVDCCTPGGRLPPHGRGYLVVVARRGRRADHRAALPRDRVVFAGGAPLAGRFSRRCSPGVSWQVELRTSFGACRSKRESSCRSSLPARSCCSSMRFPISQPIGRQRQGAQSRTDTSTLPIPAGLAAHRVSTPGTSSIDTRSVTT